MVVATVVVDEVVTLIVWFAMVLLVPDVALLKCSVPISITAFMASLSIGMSRPLEKLAVET